MGAAKTGGNYASSLVAQQEATAQGCDQVVFLDVAEGRYVVRPVGGPGSHLVHGLAHANALIVIPEAVTEVAEGSAVEVMVLERRLT
jgi:branched-chain amino acid aminotransferase